MVTEGPGSLVEFSRDAKEVSPGLLWFVAVLRMLSQGSGVGLLLRGMAELKSRAHMDS